MKITRANKSLSPWGRLSRRRNDVFDPALLVWLRAWENRHPWLGSRMGGLMRTTRLLQAMHRDLDNNKMQFQSLSALLLCICFRLKYPRVGEMLTWWRVMVLFMSYKPHHLRRELCCDSFIMGLGDNCFAAEAASRT